MIEHQQLLFKHKKSFKLYKALPFYELPNYEYIKLRKESTIDFMKESSRLVKPDSLETKKIIKKYIYRFRSSKYKIDIQSVHFLKTCTILGFNPGSINIYLRSGEYYFKDFVIIRKLLKEYIQVPKKNKPIKIINKPKVLHKKKSVISPKYVPIIKPKEYINRNQKWIYTYINEKFNIEIEFFSLKRFCDENDLKQSHIETYIKHNYSYKGFTITRKLI